MRNIINVTFTYDLPDDQYYQTNVLRKTTSWEYSGPDKKYILVDSVANTLTGGVIEEVDYEHFNDYPGAAYAVEVDCSQNPLICSLFADAHEDPTSINTPTISEDIPNSVPYVRDNPSAPDHTYEIREIEYNKSSNTFVTPLPWKKPFVTWDLLFVYKNMRLANTDRQLSEDLPPALYTAMIEYRQYLRDFGELFGASWIVTLANSGSGFAVGDRIAISDPIFKSGNTVDDIILTVTEIDSSGAITKFTKSNTRALYNPSAATYSNVYCTTNGAGTGFSVTLSKAKLVDPWKITPRESPLG